MESKFSEMREFGDVNATGKEGKGRKFLSCATKREKQANTNREMNSIEERYLNRVEEAVNVNSLGCRFLSTHKINILGTDFPKKFKTLS